MSLASALHAGRRAAERMMTDTVRVRYKTGNMTQDPDTGSTVPEMATRIASSPARFKSNETQPMTEEVGGRTATTIRLLLELPAMTSPIPSVADEVEILAVGSTSNPARVGLTYEVTGEPIGTHETKVRLPVRRLLS